jgi:hypothetical protein
MKAAGVRSGYGDTTNIVTKPPVAAIDAVHHATDGQSAYAVTYSEFTRIGASGKQ